MFEFDETVGRSTVLLKNEFEGKYGVVYPIWGSATNVFRILPGRLPNGDLVNGVSYNGRCGPWIHLVYGMTVTSPTRQKTFFIGDRATHDEYSMQRSLAYQVYSTVYDVIASGSKPEWREYNLIRLRGEAFDATRPTVLRRPGIFYLVFAEVLEHSQKESISPNPPVVLVLTQTAGQALVMAARKAFSLGKDIVKDGIKVNIRPTHLGSPYPALCTEKGNAGFAVDILAEAIPHPISEETLTQIRPWSEILKFASDDEQKEIFREMLPRDVVKYLFGEDAVEDSPAFDDIPFDVPDTGPTPLQAEQPADDMKTIDILRQSIEAFHKKYKIE